MNNEITYTQTLPIWWGMAWRGILLGFVAGAVAGFFAGILAGILGMPEKGVIFGAVSGYLVSIPVSIWALRRSLIAHRVKLDG